MPRSFTKISGIAAGAAFGITAVGASTAFTILLEPVLRHNVLFIQLAAVAITAAYTDLWIAILTAGLAVISHNVFGQFPKYSLSVDSVIDLAELVIFFAFTLLVSYFVNRLRTAIRTAERAVEAREEVLGIVSHDLKNPLSVIEIQASLLSRSMAGNPDHTQRSIQQIRDSVRQMSQLINSLLDLERLRTGRILLDTRPTRASSLLASAQSAMAPIAAQSAIRLEMRIEGPDFALRCDPDRLLQVFSNLLANAFKFSAPGTRVSVRARCDASRAIFAIEDQGSGISPENLPHIFDRYWQARATARQGTGLGLAIVQGIVHAHGGRVSVQSTLGAGTTFTIVLPGASELKPESAIA